MPGRGSHFTVQDQRIHLTNVQANLPISSQSTHRSMHVAPEISTQPTNLKTLHMICLGYSPSRLSSEATMKPFCPYHRKESLIPHIKLVTTYCRNGLRNSRSKDNYKCNEENVYSEQNMEEGYRMSNAKSHDICTTFLTHIFQHHLRT